MKRLLATAFVAFALGAAGVALADRIDQYAAGTADWDVICFAQQPGGGIIGSVRIHAPSVDGGEPFLGECSAQLSGAQLTQAQSFAANRLAACANSKRIQ